MYEGAWPTLIGAPFAAAAAAGGVLGLGREALVHALAMAAARATRIAGPVDASAFRGARPPAVGEVDVKPICTARQVQSAVEAARLAAGDVGGKAPARVAVHVPGQCLAMVDRPDPADRLGSIASVQYQVAAGLVRPEVLDDVVRAAVRDEEAVRALVGRVTVAACPELTARYPSRWGARVELWTPDGAHAERKVLEPRGSAPRPLDWDDLLEKHRRLRSPGDGASR